MSVTSNMVNKINTPGAPTKGKLPPESFKIPFFPFFNGLNRAHLTVNAELDNLSILVLPYHKQRKIRKYLLE